MRTPLLALALGLVAAAGAQAATIQNGSFESPAVGGGFTSYGAGSTALTGWTIGGAGVDHINGYWLASDGQLSLDMSGPGAGSISQTVSSLIAGRTYTVTFDMSGNPDGGNAVKDMQVSAAGASQDYAFDTSVIASRTTDMMWQTMSFDFVATAGSETLTFSSLETNAWGPALDNVGISLAPVPLPAGAALLIGTLGGLGALRRRR